MIKEIIELFADAELIERVKKRLPQFFHLAELESSRAGKIGMEVGMIRERIISALLIHKFGVQNVITDIPATETEVDVFLFNKPISIKTITGTKFGGIKLIWTVDERKAIEFSNNYKPTCDMILVQINWGGVGGVYFLPLEIQLKELKVMGKNNYVKLPKLGTNPRGVEMHGEAMRRLIANKGALSIPIDWRKEEVDFNPFNRWVELWSIE